MLSLPTALEVASFAHGQAELITFRIPAVEGDFNIKNLKWKHQAAYQENSWDALIIVPLNLFSKNMKIACFRQFVADRHPDRGVGMKDAICGVPETFAPVILEK